MFGQCYHLVPRVALGSYKMHDIYTKCAKWYNISFIFNRCGCYKQILTWHSWLIINFIKFEITTMEQATAFMKPKRGVF